MAELEARLDSVFRRLTAEQPSLWAALKGLRNGLCDLMSVLYLSYGARIRAPHALVMALLFGRGTLLEKLQEVFTLTRRHATNLGCFVFGYKALLGLIRHILRQRFEHWHPLGAAALVGYFVFSEENGINTQINLYLLSRVLYALAKLSAKKGFITPSFNAFPLFSAAVWGLVLWLFEQHPHSLQKSLQSSMEYLYHESNSWQGIRDFLLT